MNYSRKGICKAIQYDGENHYIIMDMYREHGKKKDKNMQSPGAIAVYCIYNKIEMHIGGEQINKGDWIVIDERGWLYPKSNKMFKQMFDIQADCPIKVTTKLITKKAPKKKAIKKGK